MIKKTTIIKIIIFLISVSGVTRVFLFPQTLATLGSLILKTLSIFLLFNIFIKTKEQLIKKKNLLYFYCIYGFIILIYSLFVSNSYFQDRYVFTVYMPSIVLPMFSLLSAKLNYAFTFLKSFLTISIPISVFLFFSEITGMGDFTHYVSFIYILILFIPYLKKFWIIILLITSILSLFYDLDSRSNLLNLCFVFILYSVYFFKKKHKLFAKRLSTALMTLPILLVSLGIFFSFNSYDFLNQFQDDVVVTNGEKDVLLLKDTRTGIYSDAWSGVTEQNDLIFGLSAAGYHKTFLADHEGYAEYYKNGRLGSESGILEYLLRGGLVFVLVIFLIHMYAMKYAINNSNNSLCKILGVYIAFRFFFMFVEGQPNLNLSNISTFIVIGLCLSTKFRSLTDKQIKHYMN